MNKNLCTCKTNKDLTCTVHDIPLKERIVILLKNSDIKTIKQAEAAKLLGLNARKMIDELSSEFTSWRRLVWEELGRRYRKVKKDNPHLKKYLMSDLVGCSRSTLYNHYERWEKEKD